MEQAPVETLVKARVVGEAMGMAMSQVYRLAARGHIRSYQVGQKKGGVRFDLREVREDLRRRPVASESESAIRSEEWDALTQAHQQAVEALKAIAEQTTPWITVEEKAKDGAHALSQYATHVLAALATHKEKG